MSLGHQHHEAVDPVIDAPRLLTQYEKIMRVMADGQWRTQMEIAALTDTCQGSVGSQLRNARVDGHTIEKRRQHEASGTWEYRLVVAPQKPRSQNLVQTEFI